MIFCEAFNLHRAAAKRFRLAVEGCVTVVVVDCPLKIELRRRAKMDTKEKDGKKEVSGEVEKDDTEVVQVIPEGLRKKFDTV